MLKNMLERVHVRVLALTLTGILGLTVPATLWGQAVPPDQGVLMEQERKAQEEKRKLEKLTPPEAPPPIEKPTRPRASKGSEAKVKVTKFKFTGNTVFRTAALEKIVSSAIDQVLTLHELNELAGLVSEHYVANGYILAQAYLPPQEIRDGVVEIAILEGKVGKLEVTGNTRYKSSTILKAMEPVRQRGLIHEATLESALNEVNDYPGLKVRAALKPGETRGSTDLELVAKERIPYTLVTDIDNYGSRFTGPWRYGAEVGIGNIFGIGDNLTLTGTKSDDNLFFTNTTYLIPVTSFGTKVQLNWVHTENVIGEEFAATRPIGRADIASVDILQPISRTGGYSITVDAGFDFKTIRNIASVPGPSGSLQSKDEIRVFRLGLKGDYRDPLLGRTYYGLTYFYFADFWGASQQNAPQTSFTFTNPAGTTFGAGPGPTSKGTADLARYQSLGFPFIQGLPVLPTVLNDSYVIFRATGQIASDRLLSPERFAIGGYYTVRGYQVAERIGDNGYAATAELVVPIPSSEKIPFGSLTWKEFIQVAAFIDHGGTFATPLQSQPQGGYGYLTGAGGGLRINLPFGVPQPVDRGTLTLKIDWASAIGRPRPTSRDQGISLNNVYGDGAPGVLYVSAALRF